MSPTLLITDLPPTETEDAAIETMSIHRCCSCADKSQDIWYCGSDKSVDFTRDCGSSCKPEGIVSSIPLHYHPPVPPLTTSFLQQRLNIPDLSFAAPASSGAAAPAAPAEEDEPAPAAQEKTLFTLKLQSFEPTAKPKSIKEVKSMLGLSLVDSKKFVESAPKVLKEGVTKEEGQKIMDTLKALGGVVAME